jgi:hypothetical protein
MRAVTLLFASLMALALVKPSRSMVVDDEVPAVVANALAAKYYAMNEYLDDISNAFGFGPLSLTGGFARTLNMTRVQLLAVSLTSWLAQFATSDVTQNDLNMVWDPVHNVEVALSNYTATGQANLVQALVAFTVAGRLYGQNQEISQLHITKIGDHAYRTYSKVFAQATVAATPCNPAPPAPCALVSPLEGVRSMLHGYKYHDWVKVGNDYYTSLIVNGGVSLAHDVEPSFFVSFDPLGPRTVNKPWMPINPQLPGSKRSVLYDQSSPAARMGAERAAALRDLIAARKH